jgi:HAD superfamily hydrolase (TIGR01509 family)
VEALDALDEMRLPWRVASNSSRAEMVAKFKRIGISHRVAGRLHSHHDVPNGKPAPDLYLAAAAAEGVAPAECLVIEDSARGVTAAVAAGMQCLGLALHSDGAALRAAGAVPFHAMAELPALVKAARRLPA